MNLRHAWQSPQVRLSLRAALCLSLPLLVGVLIHERSYAIVFSIGALWAISQDGLDEWHVRGPRLLWLSVSAGAGSALGASVVGVSSAEWVLVVLFGATAFVAGLIEASNRATQGAYFLIGCVVGAGLQFSGHVWQSCLMVLLGGLWVYVAAALTDARRRHTDQRSFLALAFDGLADVIAAVAQPTFYRERARGVALLDDAQDVVGARRKPASEEDVVLRQCLIVALRSGELVSYLEGKGRPLDDDLPRAFRDVARALRDEAPASIRQRLDALVLALEDATGLDTAVSSLIVSDVAQLSSATPAQTSRASTRVHLPALERARFAGILTLAVVAGTLVAQALDGPHGFWLPLSVAFILRPDLGPVITRAVARTVGTIIGVGIAALVAFWGNSIAFLIVLSCLMAASVPWAAKRSHLLAVMTFTPIVFVFLSLLGTDKYLLGPRIVDTALGAAIVLGLDAALWSTAPTLRPVKQLELARAASRRYERDASLDDVLRRHLLRRAALRAVANARGSIDRARAEPHPLRRPPPDTLAALDEVEASIDAHTVRLIEHSSRPPRP